MGRRVSSGWLIGVLVLLTGLGLSASLIRFRKCGSCHSLALTSRSRVDCPDCADTGKVSLLRSWSPRVSHPIAQFLGGVQDPSGSLFLQALEPLVANAGMGPDAFLNLHGHGGTFGFPRFVTADGSPYLVLVVYYPAVTFEDDAGVGFLLIHSDGPALDFVQMTCRLRDAVFAPLVLESRGADGALLAIVPTGLRPNVDPAFRYRLYQWRCSPREGTGRDSGESFCRLKIRADRFEILAPK